MFKHLIRKILGRQTAAEKKIVSPYVGLTDAEIIARRRKIATLYPTPPMVNPDPTESEIRRRALRSRERAVEREADGMGFTTGLLLGSAFISHGGPVAVPSDGSIPEGCTPVFEAGGGQVGGGGASESWGSSDSGSSDSGGSDSGGGDSGGGGGGE